MARAEKERIAQEERYRLDHERPVCEAEEERRAELIAQTNCWQQDRQSEPGKCLASA
jgi:hypothetical protein